MNKLIRYFNSFAALCALVIFSTCSDEGLSPIEEAKMLITESAWNLQQAQVDGVDHSNTYKNLKLTFTSTSITAVNGGVIWPASDTWNFQDDKGKRIILGSGLELELAELTKTKLVIKLLWGKNTIGPGRINSVSGQHTFTFTK